MNLKVTTYSQHSYTIFSRIKGASLMGKKRKSGGRSKAEKVILEKFSAHHAGVSFLEIKLNEKQAIKT